MSDFSLEIAAERIVNARTKEYFGEVLRCYQSESYRSAVVMLWSVVVCDILFKLQEIETQYADPTAQQILSEIKKYQATSPTSPEWERKLLQQVKDRTHLLDPGDFENLSSLQAHRHLSAHPILTSAEILFAPNRETVRSHIRNALEGVLTKPAIMTKKVFDAFVEDLESYGDRFPTDSSLTKYLDAKYFTGSVDYVLQALFRSLWKIVFRIRDSRAESNRQINYRALDILYRKKPDRFQSAIQKERSYFSDVELSGSAFLLFTKFVAEHPEVYGFLNDTAKIPLETAANSDLEAFVYAWFLDPSVAAHLSRIKDKIVPGGQPLSEESFQHLYAKAKENGMREQALDVAIHQFRYSSSFDLADTFFTTLIGPYLTEFSPLQLEHIVKIIDTNGQIHGRRRARFDHPQVKKQLEVVFNGTFKYEDYPNFAETVGIEPVKDKLVDEEPAF